MDIKKTGKIEMVIGGVATIIGVALTYYSYRDTGSSGVYIFFWGLIIFGVYKFFKGLDKIWYG